MFPQIPGALHGGKNDTSLIGGKLKSFGTAEPIFILIPLRKIQEQLAHWDNFGIQNRLGKNFIVNYTIMIAYGLLKKINVWVKTRFCRIFVY